MPHARKSAVRQAITGGSPTPRPQPIPSLRPVEGPTHNPSKLGARDPVPAGPDASSHSSAPLKARVFLWEVQGIRQLGTPDQPWFVAKDICGALEIQNPTEAVRNLDDDEKGLRITETLGGPQELVVVNESGLYALIFRSRKPSARLFRKWVTSEVLPAIRKTGSFGRPVSPRSELPAPSSESPYRYFIRQDAFRVRDLADEDFGRLLYELLYENGEGCSRRLVTLHEIARACVKYHRLWWIVAAADYLPDRVALGKYLAKRNGLPTTRTTGPHYCIRSIGTNRHKRWLVLRSDNRLWQRTLEEEGPNRGYNYAVRKELSS